MRYFKALLPIIFLLMNAQALSAAELTIEDTLGNVRNVSDISASATIRFKVTDPQGKPLNGALINLASKESSEKRQGVSADGYVEFLNVSPGQWVVSTENPNLLFAQIDISDYGTVAMASLGQDTTLSTAGTGGIIAGVAILATGITIGTTSSSDSKKEMSPHT